MSRQLLLATVGALFAALSLTGCLGYRFGKSSGIPFRSIYIAPPINTSLAPQSTNLLGSVMRRQMDMNDEVRLASENRADVVLEVRLTDIQREISADRGNDSGLARKWRITLTAMCTLRDTRSDKVYFQDRPISAFDEVYSDSGQVNAETQNMPVLATRLGEAIVREVLATW